MHPRRLSLPLAGAAIACFLPIAGHAQNAAPQPPREIPARILPVPDTVSPEMQRLIAAPLNPAWNTVPKTPEEWRALSAKAAEGGRALVPGLKERFGVALDETAMGGVRVYVATPKEIAPENRNRVLIYLHGGAFVLNPDIAGAREAIVMAGYGRVKVISVDYRMPPDHPFPAAYDDAYAVWRDVIKTTPAQNAAVFGSSAGGGLALSLALRLKAEGLPLPGALGLGSPWTEMSGRGDSFATHEFVDNFLVSNNGFLDASAKLYSGGVDLRDPRLSPIYGDLNGMPPTILTTGTRDLFLSNTARTHRALRDAGVTASIQVFEGMSHIGWSVNAAMPEGKAAFLEMAEFFDRHLGR
jgi:acetyl esterase/lipase